MEFTADLDGAAWIAPRLGRFGTVSGVVPRGFAAYVRIFHPFSVGGADGENRELRWAELAELTGRVFHPLAQSGGLGVPPGQQTTIGDRYFDPGQEGWLDGARLASLVGLLTSATTGQGVTVGIWNGWGELHSGTVVVGTVPPVSDAELRELTRRYRAERAAAIDPRLAAAVESTDGHAEPGLLHLPNRDYALLRGELAELTDPDWGFTAGIGWHDESRAPGPQLIWPDDRAWFIGSEIDFDSTLVGCARETADAILASPAVEALEVPPDADLSWRGDRLNPPFADWH
jgi:hypothetical protein